MTWMTKQLIALLVAIVIAVGVADILPCFAESALGDSLKARIKPASVETIIVKGDGNTAELVIGLSAPATYTSYKTTLPLRLVIDLSQAIPGSISAPIELGKGNFKRVVARRFDTDAGVLTRLEIELIKDADPVISVSKEKAGEIRVSFPSLSAKVAAPAVLGGAGLSTAPLAPTTGELLSPSSASQASAVSDNAVEQSANITSRTLTAFSVKDNIIELLIDGGAGEFKTFRLNKPERYVIDLFNVKSALASKIVAINSIGISSARLGVYPDKVRVVLGALGSIFPEITVVKTSSGISVSKKVSREILNSLPPAKPIKATPPQTHKPVENSVNKESVSMAAAEAPLVAAKPVSQEKVEASAVRGSFASVEMIDFQVVNGISRVAVKVAGDISVDTPAKSSGFVTLTIKNAVLPKRLQHSLEAKGFISPVLRVTPLLVRTRKRTDVKIRVAMRRTVPFEFRQEGDVLLIDFKNPLGMATDKASSDIQELRPLKARPVKAPSGKEIELGSALTSQAESSLKSPGPSKFYKGRKVTLEFADADVRKIFQLLSEVSNKNFVLGDDVTGTISIKLVNVPWDQALDIILDAKGLDKREDGNIIIIKGKGKFKSQAEEDLELKKAKLKATELETHLFNVNYANVDDIVTQFKAMMTDGVGATVNKDARTNKVIVKDIPQAIKSMSALLKELDVPEKQVMIEARIIEATATFSHNLGVNWGLHYRDGTGSILGISGLDSGFGGLTSLTPPTKGTGGDSAGGSMGISFGTLGSNVELDLRLSAAASVNLIKIVSSPKVATLNNKTATILQGQQYPYTTATSDKVEVKFLEALLSIEVTPHINLDGTISMKINAKNNSLGELAGGSSTPALNRKEALTEMLLKDGETTVIGGIFVDNDNDTDQGVPWLMDIPVLGKLFKSTTKQKNKTELLIFITPRILGLS